MYSLLDDLSEPVLVLKAISAADGRVTDFSIEHVSPGYRDPGGQDGREPHRDDPAGGLPGQRVRPGPVRPGRAGAHRGHVPARAGAGGLADGQVLRRRDRHLAGRALRGPDDRPAGARAAPRAPGRMGGGPRQRHGPLDRFGVRPVRPHAPSRGGDPAGGSAQLRDGGRQARGEAAAAAPAGTAGSRDGDFPRRPPRGPEHPPDPRLRRAGDRCRRPGGRAARRVPGRLGALPDSGGPGRHP